MKFEINRPGQHELGAPIQDVAQEAVDATARTYAGDPGIDVEEHLRTQLSSRGIAAADDETVDHLAREIRAGHDVTVGQHDGSVDI
jgi:hypothetical protein